MLNYQGEVDYHFRETKIQCIVVDLSRDIERFGILLNALELRLIKNIAIEGVGGSRSISICLKDESFFMADEHKLQLTSDQIVLLKKMICDVAIGNSFPGSHVDFEIPSKNGSIDLCMILS